MILSPLWLPATLAAALFQCWRTALQQRLRGQLSVNGAAVVRYLYGVPVGAALLTSYLAATGGGLPAPNARFLLFCAGRRRQNRGTFYRARALKRLLRGAVSAAPLAGLLSAIVRHLS